MYDRMKVSRQCKKSNNTTNTATERNGMKENIRIVLYSEQQQQYLPTYRACKQDKKNSAGISHDLYYLFFRLI